MPDICRLSLRHLRSPTSVVYLCSHGRAVEIAQIWFSQDISLASAVDIDDPLRQLSTGFVCILIIKIPIMRSHMHVSHAIEFYFTYFKCLLSSGHLALYSERWRWMTVRVLKFSLLKCVLWLHFCRIIWIMQENLKVKSYWYCFFNIIDLSPEKSNRQKMRYLYTL